MINELHLSNFKAWKNLDIKLNRVTGLFGTNSSGKSSILQFLLMLKQTKNATDRGLVLDLGGPDQLVNLGTFNDMVHKHQDSSPLKWTIKWELTKTLKIANPSGKRTEILFQGNVLETAAEVSFKNQEMKSQRLAYRFAQHSFEMKPKEATKDYLLQASSQGGTDFQFVRQKGRVWNMPSPVVVYQFNLEFNICKPAAN